MIPVILSGGGGTRLWPVSRTNYPKQFCKIFDDSLQTMTLKRCSQLGQTKGQVWVVASEKIKLLTEKSFKSLGLTGECLFEPFGRNTAPAVAWLCHYMSQKGFTNEIISIFPADHLVQDEKEFAQVIKFAEDMAKQNKVVTLGIRPTHPETGFGYIQTLKSTSFESGKLKGFSVLKFHEKPSLEKAEDFIQDGHFYWNAGIFVFKVARMIEHFKKHEPQMWEQISQIKTDNSNIKEIYEKVKDISIDYAIMEKLTSDDLACIPCDLGWSDVGSWDAVSEKLKTQDNQVVEVHGQNNFVFSMTKEKAYATCGVDDLLIVDTNDVLMIVKKGESQKVKDVVTAFKEVNPKLLSEHGFEERPWGEFEILRDTPHFKSKVIRVNPGASISYQSHNKREEHWTITQGAGEVVLNDEVIPVKAGTHIHIPLQAKHRIRNTGTKMLEFVEVQLGTYFGEDDIIRYQDDYKRV